MFRSRCTSHFFFLSGALFIAVAMSGCSTYHSVVLKPKEWRAERDFRHRQYGFAAGQFEQLHLDHPRGYKSEYFLLQKGRCYYQMRDFIDAYRTFGEQRRLYPDGEFAGEAQAYMAKVEVIRNQDRELAQAQIDKAKNNANELIALIDQDPSNAHLRHLLGDALWQLERYDDAARQYVVATELNAALYENDLIKGRLHTDESGAVVPLTPQLADEIERKRNPLVVISENRYVLNDQRYDGQGMPRKNYRVSGVVLNRGDETLRNVTVEVWFLNALQEVVDVQTYRIGLMLPGHRGFTVVSSFSDTNNISNHEISFIY